MRLRTLFACIMFFAVALAVGASIAQEPTGATSADEMIRELTLLQMISKGGFILWVIMALSVVALIMMIYFFMTVTKNREVSPKLAKRIHTNLASSDVRGAFQLCEGRDDLLSRVVLAGLKVVGHERYVIQEAMESEGERGATELWQKVSYLNNVSVIAPLLGLLGTVWGMIGAFGAIALNDAEVKGIAMAYKVSEAMITTAAGLFLAIPAMVAYFYLRGRVVRIVAGVEGHAAEFVELLVRSREL